MERQANGQVAEWQTLIVVSVLIRHILGTRAGSIPALPTNFKFNQMEQWEAPSCGTTRISNPKTLQRWVDLGWYKELIDDGFIFAPYCGRFKTEICECGKCRNKKPNRDELIKIIKWETSQTT